MGILALKEVKYIQCPKFTYRVKGLFASLSSGAFILMQSLNSICSKLQKYTVFLKSFLKRILSYQEI